MVWLLLFSAFLIRREGILMLDLAFDLLIYDLREIDAGRVDIDWDSKLVRSLSKLYKGPFLRAPTPPPEYSELPTQHAESTTVRPDRMPGHFEPSRQPAKGWVVKLNIVIQVVGSRGDVQPF